MYLSRRWKHFCWLSKYILNDLKDKKVDIVVFLLNDTKQTNKIVFFVLWIIREKYYFSFFFFF